MAHQYLYTGCFFDFSEIAALAKKHAPERLHRVIQTPHVTFTYQPDTVDTSLFGTAVQVTLVGYGNNEENEGFRVVLTSDNKDVQTMIDTIEVPHITLSVSEDGRARNTKFLTFRDIQPIQITGIYGGYTQQHRVDCRKK